MSYRVDREKNRDDADNSTVIAAADTDYTYHR